MRRVSEREPKEQTDRVQGHTDVQSGVPYTGRVNLQPVEQSGTTAFHTSLDGQAARSFRERGKRVQEKEWLICFGKPMLPSHHHHHHHHLLLLAQGFYKMD